MISSIQIFESSKTDPYWNLAVEERLLKCIQPGECILYLWQNRNTVVIGRNQNPWVECRTQLLESEDGKLARRLSGGGAVYHDLGNLNFTFIMHEEDYDLLRQLEVIRTACGKIGINAEFSGRNDLLIDGRKFSGSAFYHADGKAYHHGTLLISADMEKLGRYLSPSKAKLQAKGVSSVRSRVANLKEFVPNVTCGEMKQLLSTSFSEVYGLPCGTLTLSDEDLSAIEEKRVRLGSWDWLYGIPLPFSFSCEERFSWGSFQLQLQINKGIIQEAKVYTDAMDWTLAETVETCLRSCLFRADAMCEAIADATGLSEQYTNDIVRLIKNQDI